MKKLVNGKANAINEQMRKLVNEKMERQMRF
jgi:hypothetical protein